MRTLYLQNVVGIEDTGHRGLASWHIYCFIYGYLPKRLPAPHQAPWRPVQRVGVGAQVRAARPRRPNEGVLHLVLRRAGQRTVLQECYFQVPLQVLRPLYLDEVGTAYVYLVSPCGGVVGGDIYSMTVVVEAGARVDRKSTRLNSSHRL